MGKGQPTGLIVVAAPGTLQEAEVIRTALRSRGFWAQIRGERMSQWFPHWGVALNPRGIEVAVPPDEAKDAAAFLEARRTEAGEAWKEERPKRRSPDDWAVAACWATLFSLLSLPLFLVTFYCYFKGQAAARRERPERPRRFRRLMTFAFLLGILPGAALAVGLLVAIVGLLIWAINWLGDPLTWP